MCMQCMVSAVRLVEDIIPGFALMIATKGQEEDWPVGHLGLVVCNDPDYTWPYKPLVDPPEDEDRIEVLTLWWRYMDEVYNHFFHDPFHSWRFYEACLKAGYNGDIGSVEQWFINRVNMRLAEMDIAKIIEESKDVA